MFFDVIVLLTVVGAVFKGMKKGLVVAVFTFIAFVLGAAVALKMSGTVAVYMAERWPELTSFIPFLSFMLLFVGVVILVRMVAGFIDKGLDLAFLGWLNKLGGVAFYVLIYLMILSIFVFYLKKLGLASPVWSENSITFPYLDAFAPKVMEWVGKIIPVFKDLFHQLEESIGPADAVQIQ